jgi:3-hydroxyacyl-CoA dehydrogenase
MIDNYLSDVAILGAGGKMGSGITLVLLRERIFNSLKQRGGIDGFTVRALDVNETALDGLKKYLSAQLSKLASKKIEKLREYHPNESDESIISQFVEKSLQRVVFTTKLEDLANAKLIFEAIVENVDGKVKVFKALKEITKGNAYFLTNTSSIPIHILDEKAELDHKIIGFHFYNPPPVQKLVEIISSDSTDPQLKTVSLELGKYLGKILVPSNDIAGFIGNGHFMRDLLFGLELFTELKEQYPDPEALWLVNRVTQDFMIRPMGIFQLMDYVGLDVCQSILTIMRTYLQDDSLQHPVLDEMVASGIKGGQNPDGTQKDGFLKYDGRKIIGVLNFKTKQYQELTEEFQQNVNQKSGPLPEGHKPWKTMLQEENRHEVLKEYFEHLKSMNTPGAELAWKYLLKSREIAEKLVNDNVAHTADDVNKVLMYGFYHLYGPISDFIIK